MQSLEDQQIEQSIAQQQWFNDWFYNEMGGSYIKACEALKDKIPMCIGMDTLFLAFFYVEPVNADRVKYDDDLPF